MNESLETTEAPVEQFNLNNNNHKFSFATVSICLVLSLVLVVYIYNNRNVPIEQSSAPVEPIAVEESGPKGSIYLTLSPLDGNNTGIYEYSFENESLTTYYDQPNGLAMTGKFEGENENRLLISEYLKSNTTQIVAISSETKQRNILTNSVSKLKRHPLWSSYYDLLIYSARPESGEVLALPDEFSVYVVDEDGSERELTKGSFPVLTPDGKSVVVLRNDGLNRVDIIGTSTEKIWGYDSGDGLTNQMFSISPDGKYIAWTFPDKGKVYVSQVSSWSPFKSQWRFVIDAHAFWPIFSPDSRYLAFEEVDWTTPPTKPRLVVVDLNSSTLEKKVVYDLSEFIQMKMFISDWLIK